MKQWEKEYIELIESITDEDDPDNRRGFIEDGLACEEHARILTEFIKKNNIDCRNCYNDHTRYLDYEKLIYKTIELDPGEPLD